jgi:hypothetical protein
MRQLGQKRRDVADSKRKRQCEPQPPHDLALLAGDSIAGLGKFIQNALAARLELETHRRRIDRARRPWPFFQELPKVTRQFLRDRNFFPGLAAIEDKVKGLGFGADDYLTKPFHKDELVARIQAIVRRSKGHAQSVIATGDLCV